MFSTHHMLKRLSSGIAVAAVFAALAAPAALAKQDPWYRNAVSSSAGAGNAKLLINASAIGYYGPRGDEELNESDSAGNDFLAGSCVDWEKSAQAAEALDVRRHPGSQDHLLAEAREEVVARPARSS